MGENTESGKRVNGGFIVLRVNKTRHQSQSILVVGRRAPQVPGQVFDDPPSPKTYLAQKLSARHILCSALQP